MTRLGAIGVALAAAGGLLLLMLLVGLVFHRSLYEEGLTMRVYSRAGLFGALGLGLLATGLRIMSNSRNI